MVPANWREEPRERRTQGGGAGKKLDTAGVRIGVRMYPKETRGARRLAQGSLARQRRVRGHFRRAQGLALPRQGLVGLDGGALHRQALSVRVQVFGRCTEEDGEPACQIVISPIGRKLVNLVFDQRDRESNDGERSRFAQWFAEDLGLSLAAKNREVGPSMHDGSSDELVGTC